MDQRSWFEIGEALLPHCLPRFDSLAERQLIQRIKSMRTCTYCGKPIILIPSAEERARKYGGNASDYTKLFTAHGSCVVNARSESARRLMEKFRAGHKTQILCR